MNLSKIDSYVFFKVYLLVFADVYIVDLDGEGKGLGESW